MKLVFTIRDVKGVYLNPSTEASIGDAVRKFEIMAKNQESLIGRFPHDYRLIQLGKWDEEVGEFQLLDRVVDHGSAADYLKPVSVANEVPRELEAVQ